MKAFCKALIVCFALSPAAITMQPATKYELQCLAETVYQEARGESFRGRLAVAQVVINRVNNPRWPHTICGVVFQRGQFSWTKNWRGWSHDYNSTAIAQLVLQYHNPHNFKATYFHSGPKPKNWNRLQYIKTIGNHHFYK